MLLTRRAILAVSSLVALPAGSACASAQEVRPDWVSRFTDAGTAGVFAVHDPRRDTLLLSDPTRAAEAFLPASTFKIPNSLIALDTGVASDADHPTFKWDGVQREFDAWNRNHTLRSAFKASAVPVYQQIARQVGAERMARYVAALNYGNRDIGGAIDRFWLDGALRISALQQIDFLRRLYRDALPVANRSQAIVKDIMLIEEGDLGVLRGKTGAVGIGTGDRAKATLGWLVGWLERGGEAYVFALNLDVRDQAQLGQRMPLAKTFLRDVVLT